MKYQVTITETLEKKVEVDAETEADALSAVQEMYRKCDIILSADDYTQTEFVVDEF